MEFQLMGKHLQLKAELKRYRELENLLREQIERSETKRRELEQSLSEVCRRESEIILKMTEVEKKLERLSYSLGAEKQLTVINQRKFLREITSLRQQLTEATEKLRATETVTKATKSREILESKNKSSELVEIWDKMGTKHTKPAVDYGIFSLSFSLIFYIISNFV